MAITGPAELPLVLRVDSNPLKKHVISQLGHPLVLVEIMEDQMEQVLRSSGDFISQYFAQEERYAFFMTTPLKAEYELPKDAYWVREISFDPVTTRISDIFGAESFLFCLDNEFKILDKFGKLQYISDWGNDWKAKTPYGDRTLTIKHRKLNKPIPKLKIDYENGSLTATINHPIMVNGNKWRELSELKIGDKLVQVKNKTSIQNITAVEDSQAISIRANKSGAYYGCHNGEPVLIH